jgi:tRNA pseudouridine32 synthase/23S rRNA pseudouridine746 synthase/23S rRNA pseudouridine1911/1915/1917 synthase
VTTWCEIRAARVLLEDGAVLVLNKPAGISVMGERHDTDLVRLAREAGEEIIPVHRIDKVTSGALLLAKNLGIHSDLTRQFSARTVDKVYLVITQSAGLPEHGVIELPLSVGRKNRVRVAAPRDAITLDETTNRWSVQPSAVFEHNRSYPSLTAFTKIWGDDSHTLLAVRPITGRRHQIRVHLAWIGHPIVGDPLFGGKSMARGVRTALHSWRLGFDAAWSGDIRLRVEAPPGPDFWTPIADRPAAHAIAGGLELARHEFA